MTTFRVHRTHSFVVVTTFILIMSTLFPRSAVAAINESFTYQGKIVNTDGTNLTTSDASCVDTGGADTCDFRVSLYDAVTGGTLVWQETKSNEELYDEDGIFNLVLDCSGTWASCEQNGGPDFTSGEIFVEVEFDPDGDGDFAEGETFTPRRELTAVPYAFSASEADTLDGIDSASFLRADAASTLTVGNTLTTEGALNVDGEITVADTTVVFDGASTDLSFTGNLTINSNDIFVRNSDGYTGIGTTNPGSALEVNGDITLGNEDWIGLDAAGARIEFDNDATDEIQIMSALVGIGTTAPSALLDIYNGNINIARDDSSDVLLSFVGDAENVTWSLGAEDSIDADFIISEGADLNTPRFFIEASTGYIGIGTTVPGAFLDLPAAVAGAATVRVNSGTVPSSPATGDIYSDGTDLFFWNGSGWDDLTGAGTLQAVYENGNTLSIESGTGALDIDASLANVDITVGEGAMTGDLRVWDGSANWILVDEDADAVIIGTAANGGGVTIDAGTGTLDFGNSNNAKTVNIATGNAADAVNLGTDATAGDTITIGNANASTTIALTGGDDWSINATGDASFGSATITTGALAVNSDSITADGATLTINAGGTVDIQDALQIAGGLTGVSTISSSGDWTWSATTPTISINSSETFTVSDGTDSFAVNASASSFSMTDGSNSVTFDLDTGPVFAGTARPSKTVTLSPEYPGAVLTPFYGAGTDTSISGTMTSDGETTPASNIRSYYSWERTPSGQHFYSVAIRLTLPQDFSAWETSNAIVVNYITESATSTNSDVDVRVYLEGNATVDASSLDNASVTWATTSFSAADLDLWNAAGETAVIYLRLGSASANYARVGDIELNYLSGF